MKVIEKEKTRVRKLQKKKTESERTESEKVTNYKGDPDSECFFIAPNSEREWEVVELKDSPVYTPFYS